MKVEEADIEREEIRKGGKGFTREESGGWWGA